MRLIIQTTAGTMNISAIMMAISAMMNRIIIATTGSPSDGLCGYDAIAGNASFSCGAKSSSA
jgi:hypothetical protein